MIVTELKKELISSLKNKDAQRVLVLRYLLSQIQNFEISLRTESKELTDEDSLLVIKRQIKSRNKALDQFRQGNRPDIVAKEEAELIIVEEIYNKFNVTS